MVQHTALTTRATAAQEPQDDTVAAAAQEPQETTVPETTTM